MKVKFGFLVDSLRGVGITNPEADFISAKIKNWKKKKGDNVSVGDLMTEVETDKVTADFNSSWSGKLLSVSYNEDEDWEVGVDKDGNELSERSEDTPYGRMLLPELGYIETEEVEQETQDKRQETQETIEIKQEAGGGRVRAAPAARKLASEHGIDINSVKGTGMGGRVMRADVEREIRGDKRHETSDMRHETGGGEESPRKVIVPKGVILLIPSREDLTIAHNLELGSMTVIASGEPVWKETLEEYNLSKVREIRSKHAKEFEKAFGVPLHMSTPLMLAVTRTLRLKDFWVFNGYWHVEDERDRKKDKVALYTSVSIGISIDLGMPRDIDLDKKTISGPRLRIATLHGAHDLSLAEFFKQHHDLMTRASSDIRARKLSQTTIRDWTGWTFIFNNVGAARHRRGNSLFTPKMSAMLNMGVIGKDGSTSLQIFFDHRMIDGVPATLFLDAVYTELMERVLPEIEMACAAIREN